MTTKSLRNEPQKRLHSLDALRGFDMFWITGGGYLAILISRLTGVDWLEHQMHHAQWAGFHFEDLIFPLFMFIAGVAIPFSVKAKLEKNVPKKTLFWKVFKRMVILILLGLLYNGTFKSGFEDGRIASVLAQIGIGYFFAAVIVIYFASFRSRIIWLVSILVAFGIIQLLVPVPGFGAGVLTPEGSINSYIDQLFLPGRLIYGNHDPEGILCSLSGIVLIILALIFSSFYPIIKKAWTSTFNMLTGGIGFILIAFFYLIIDHWGFKKWAFYFRIIGMNSIFVYLFTRIIDISYVSKFFFGWLAKPLSEESGTLLITIGGMGIVWLLLYFMYKKKIFLRV